MLKLGSHVRGLVGEVGYLTGSDIISRRPFGVKYEPKEKRFYVSAGMPQRWFYVNGQPSKVEENSLTVLNNIQALREMQFDRDSWNETGRYWQSLIRKGVEIIPWEGVIETSQIMEVCEDFQAKIEVERQARTVAYNNNRANRMIVSGFKDTSGHGRYHNTSYEFYSPDDLVPDGYTADGRPVFASSFQGNSLRRHPCWVVPLAGRDMVTTDRNPVGGVPAISAIHLIGGFASGGDKPDHGFPLITFAEWEAISGIATNQKEWLAGAEKVLQWVNGLRGQVYYLLADNTGF